MSIRITKAFIYNPYTWIFVYAGVSAIITAVTYYDSNSLFETLGAIIVGGFLVLFAFIEENHPGRIWLATVIALATGTSSLLKFIDNHQLIYLVAVLIGIISIIDAVFQVRKRTKNTPLGYIC